MSNHDQLDSSYKDFGDPSKGYQDAGQIKAAQDKVSRDSLRRFTNEVMTGQRNRPKNTAPPPPPHVEERNSALPVRGLNLGIPLTPQGVLPTGSDNYPEGFNTAEGMWKVWQQTSGTNFQVGIDFRSYIRNTPNAGDFYKSVTGTLSSDTPTRSDSGWITVSKTSDWVVYLELTTDVATNWPFNGGSTWFTAATIQNCALSSYPASGLYEGTYTAGPPETMVPKFSRLDLLYSYHTGSNTAPRVMVTHFGMVTMKMGYPSNLDSGGAHPISVPTPFPGSL